MPHKQPNLERQLAIAQNQLDARVAVLNERGIADKAVRNDPAWRQLNAVRLKLKSRLGSAAAVVALDEEVKQRKANKPAKGEAEGGKKSKKSKKGDKTPKAEKKKKS